MVMVFLSKPLNIPNNLHDYVACAEYLKKKEVKIQARENKIRERRAARLAAEKLVNDKSELTANW